jgi:hypothetical protein
LDRLVHGARTARANDSAESLTWSWEAASSVAHLVRCDDLFRGLERCRLRIPAKPITDSELMAITIPSDADRRRSEATLGCSYHAEVIGIRQSLRG